MKISILLPYKENFSPNYAGSISLFVSQTVKKSNYLKCIKIFGSTDYKKILLNNYINIKLNSKFYESTSKRFIKDFIIKDIWAIKKTTSSAELVEENKKFRNSFFYKIR